MLLILPGSQALASDTQARIDKDIAEGAPVVIHVTVALADNKHQWIAPVPESIGNGQDPGSNLYWGARYGLKTYLKRDAGWHQVFSTKPDNKQILERLVLKKTLRRSEKAVQVILVADAWDGRNIKDAVIQFERFNAGYDALQLNVNGAVINAGGLAHLQVYIGHNVLMDYMGLQEFFISKSMNPATNLSNDAIVLACKSQQYFEGRLIALNSHPLVMTTGLMAPEAYILASIIPEWIKGKTEKDIRKAAAAAYDSYQHTGKRAAERLFGVN